jgi:cell division protein FtsQ
MFAVLVVALVWTAFWSPLLKVRTVRVSGSKHVTSAEVTRAARISSGTNILLLSTAAVVRDAETLPWVRHARVDRSLPGTVRVRIVERHPALVVSQNSTRWLIDPSGHVIARARGHRRGLPTVAGLHEAHIEPGTALQTSAAHGVLKAWRSLPPKLGRQVVAMFAPTVDAITLSLRDGTTIRYGPPQALKDKNRVILALLHKTKVEGTGASYIDVRVPTSPAVAPVSSPTPTPTSAVSSVVATPTPTPSPSATN